MGPSNIGTSHPMLATDAASAWLGIETLALSDGHATIRMTLRAEMMNGFGVTHGGMIFAFADSAFALACNPVDGDTSTMTVASGADVNFLRPTTAGQVLTAVADRRAGLGRSGIYDVQVFATGDDTGAAGATLIAEFRGRSRTVPARSRTEA